MDKKVLEMLKALIEEFGETQLIADAILPGGARLIQIVIPAKSKERSIQDAEQD